LGVVIHPIPRGGPVIRPHTTREVAPGQVMHLDHDGIASAVLDEDGRSQIAGVTDTIAVRIRLRITGVGDIRTVVAGVAEAIAIGVQLRIHDAVSIGVHIVWVGYGRTVVTGVADTVAVRVELVEVGHGRTVVSGVRDTVIVIVDDDIQPHRSLRPDVSIEPVHVGHQRVSSFRIRSGGHGSTPDVHQRQRLFHHDDFAHPRHIRGQGYEADERPLIDYDCAVIDQVALVYRADLIIQQITDQVGIGNRLDTIAIRPDSDRRDFGNLDEFHADDEITSWPITTHREIHVYGRTRNDSSITIGYVGRGHGTRKIFRIFTNSVAVDVVTDFGTQNSDTNGSRGQVGKRVLMIGPAGIRRQGEVILKQGRFHPSKRIDPVDADRHTGTIGGPTSQADHEIATTAVQRLEVVAAGEGAEEQGEQDEDQGERFHVILLQVTGFGTQMFHDTQLLILPSRHGQVRLQVS